MSQDNTLRQALDEYMDWLSDLPEDKIRRMYAGQRVPRNVDFNWTIDGTEYIVTSHFKKNDGDAIFNQLLRLLENEITDY